MLLRMERIHIPIICLLVIAHGMQAGPVHAEGREAQKKEAGKCPTLDFDQQVDTLIEYINWYKIPGMSDTSWDPDIIKSYYIEWGRVQERRKLKSLVAQTQKQVGINGASRDSETRAILEHLTTIQGDLNETTAQLLQADSHIHQAQMNLSAAKTRPEEEALLLDAAQKQIDSARTHLKEAKSRVDTAKTHIIAASGHSRISQKMQQFSIGKANQLVELDQIITLLDTAQSRLRGASPQATEAEKEVVAAQGQLGSVQKQVIEIRKKLIEIQRNEEAGEAWTQWNDANEKLLTEDKGSLAETIRKDLISAETQARQLRDLRNYIASLRPSASLADRLVAAFLIYDQWHAGDLYSSSLQRPIDADSQRLQIRLSSPPLSRLRFSLDRNGEHKEIEWDPTIPDSLNKSLILQPGTWQMSFWSEPLLRTDSPYTGGTHYVVINLNCFRPMTDQGGQIEAVGQFVDALSKDHAIPQFPEFRATLTFHPLSEPAIARDLGSNSPVFTAHDVNGRGLTDPLPPGVREAFELLAEIAVERARSRGLALLKDRIDKTLCERLTWGRVIGRFGAGNPATDMQSDQPLLPRTCAVLASLRLQDVASSARPMLRALREDFVWTIIPFFVYRLHDELGWDDSMKPLYSKLIGIAADISAGKRPSREHARLLLLALAHHPWIEGQVLSNINQKILAQHKRLRTIQIRVQTLSKKIESLKEQDARLVKERDELQEKEKKLTSEGRRHRRMALATAFMLVVVRTLMDRSDSSPSFQAQVLSLLHHEILAELIRDGLASADLNEGMHEILVKMVIEKLPTDTLQRSWDYVMSAEHLRSLKTEIGEKCVGKQEIKDRITCLWTMSGAREDLAKQISFDELGRIARSFDPEKWAKAQIRKHLLDALSSSDDLRPLGQELTSIIDQLGKNYRIKSEQALRSMLLVLLDAKEKRKICQNASGEYQTLCDKIDSGIRDMDIGALEQVGNGIWIAIQVNGNEAARALVVDLLIAREGIDTVRDLLEAMKFATPDHGSTQQLAIALAKALMTKMFDMVGGPDINPGVACGLDLAFVALSRCAEDGACTASDISRIIQAPHEYFRPASGVSAVCWDQHGRFRDLAETWPDLDVFVSRAKAVLAPPSNATDDEVVSAAVELFFDAFERLQCGKRPLDCRNDKGFLMLQTLRPIVRALAERDVATVLTKSGELVHQYLNAHCTKEDESKCRDYLGTLHRATELIGVIAAYAATFEDKAQGEEAAKAAREARKRAIESLIDAATDRREREGDWIASLGANVGFGAGWQRVRSDSVDRFGETERMGLQLGLPMGIALQKLPSGKKGRNVPGWNRPFAWIGRLRCKWCGLHLQLSLVDLGQFLATKDGELNHLSWRDFATMGGQVGIIVGKPTTPFVAGVDLRWSPSLFPDTDEMGTQMNEKQGAIRLMVFASYYVPFFDLN